MAQLGMSINASPENHEDTYDNIRSGRDVELSRPGVVLVVNELDSVERIGFKLHQPVRDHVTALASIETQPRQRIFEKLSCVPCIARKFHA